MRSKATNKKDAAKEVRLTKQDKEQIKDKLDQLSVEQLSMVGMLVKHFMGD